MNQGVKQVQGNVATFTPPQNFYDTQLNTAANRVVIEQKETAAAAGDVDAFDSLAAVHQSAMTRQRIADDDQSYGSFNDDSTGMGVSYTTRDLDHDIDPVAGKQPPKRSQLSISKLGVVYHEPIVNPDTKEKVHVEAALERTESFAGISTYFSRATKPILLETKPKIAIKKLVSKRHEKKVVVVSEMPEGFYEINLNDPVPEPVEEELAQGDDSESLTDQEKEDLITLFLTLSPEEQQKMLVHMTQ